MLTCFHYCYTHVTHWLKDARHNHIYKEALTIKSNVIHGAGKEYGRVLSLDAACCSVGICDAGAAPLAAVVDQGAIAKIKCIACGLKSIVDPRSDEYTSMPVNGDGVVGRRSFVVVALTEFPIHDNAGAPPNPPPPPQD